MKTIKSNFFFYKDCSEIHIKPDSIEHGYLLILNNDLHKAKEIFTQIDSPRAKWGYILCSILSGYLEKYPTFFQLRNFLEIDLDFLIKNEKIEYIEQFLGALDLLATINMETYKFTARVMFENNLYSLSLNYMEKSKKLHYKDPELHFMLAKYYLKMHEYKQANYYINECAKILPDYYPIQLLKNEIEENLI